MTTRPLARQLAVLALILALPALAAAQEGDPAADAAPSGAQTIQALTLPPGFSEELVADGLAGPTSMAFLPDGRILVAEQAGVVRIWKDGALLAEPFLDLRGQVNDYFESGLIGLAVDADFSSNGFVYALWTYENDPSDYKGSKTGRVARFTVSGDAAALDSEVVLLGTTVGKSCDDFPSGVDCIPGDNKSHIHGVLETVADGTLFVGLGDGGAVEDVAVGPRAQRLDSLGGKILRITRDGQGLADNPFFDGDPASNRSKVWAYGVRAPFRLSQQPDSGLLVLGDVGGGRRDELDVVTAGANLGYPCYEGELSGSGGRVKPICEALYESGAPAVTFPRLSFHHDVSRTIIGGTFYNGSAYPEPYRGAYLFGDWVYGFVDTLRFDESGQVSDGPRSFVEHADGLVAVRMGPDELVYLLSYNSGRLVRLRYDGTSDPGPSRQPAGTVVSALYGNGDLEGAPVTSLVERVNPADVVLEDGTTRAGWSFGARWTEGAPAAWTQSDEWSVRWTAAVPLEAGDYQLVVRADDGIRVWLDGELLVDSWTDQPPTTYTVSRTVSEGAHSLQVEYSHRGPKGEVEVGWVPSDSPPPAAE